MSTFKEEIQEIVSEHIEDQLQEYFSGIAEEFNVTSGDITPWQSFTLSKINDLLTELTVEYIEQNDGTLPNSIRK